MHGEMHKENIQEAMHVLLQKMLRQVLMCASWYLRKQAYVPML